MLKHMGFIILLFFLNVVSRIVDLNWYRPLNFWYCDIPNPRSQKKNRLYEPERGEGGESDNKWQIQIEDRKITSPSQNPATWKNCNVVGQPAARLFKWATEQILLSTFQHCHAEGAIFQQHRSHCLSFLCFIETEALRGWIGDSGAYTNPILQIGKSSRQDLCCTATVSREIFLRMSR